MAVVEACRPASEIRRLIEQILSANLLWRAPRIHGMEPIMRNTSVIFLSPGYLEQVKELSNAHCILLIFDEVITGFRVGLTGAQGNLRVTPDLALFAKALATGFPSSCLAGRADVMELFGKGEVMHGGTFKHQRDLVRCSAGHTARTAIQSCLRTPRRLRFEIDRRLAHRCSTQRATFPGAGDRHCVPDSIYRTDRNS